MELSPFEMLLVALPLKNFPTYYETRMFITVFTRAHTDPYPEPDRSRAYHPILYFSETRFKWLDITSLSVRLSLYPSVWRYI
jgi:hypothetical protein